MQPEEFKSNGGQLGLTPLSAILDQLGLTRVTGWRWEKRGWIRPIRIAGRLYISADEVQRFLDRASRGELTAVKVAAVVRGAPTPPAVEVSSLIAASQRVAGAHNSDDGPLVQGLGGAS